MTTTQGKLSRNRREKTGQETGLVMVRTEAEVVDLEKRIIMVLIQEMASVTVTVRDPLEEMVVND